MPDLLIFAGFALAAVWSRGRLDQAATAMAAFLAWLGVQEHWRGGWLWDDQQVGAYAGLAALMVLLLAARFRGQLEFDGWKPPLDYGALVIWGCVQQGVLLAWMAQVNPWLAVVIFAVIHLPNSALFVVTLAGGAASVGIAAHFGAPSILLAGLVHAGLSWWLRDWCGVDMGVGRSYWRRRIPINIW